MKIFKTFLVSLILMIPSISFAQSSFPLDQPGLYKHITSATTTVIKNGAGVLRGICINTKGASLDTATVYDNTTASGTVIAVIDTTATTGCLIYNTGFETGLTILTATGTAPDITVIYQ